MVNDVKSNGAVEEGRELELREAMLKFRGPKTSEVEEEMGGCVPFMMSASVEKDWLSRGELRRSSS